MTDIDKLLTSLSNIAQPLSPPPVDVRWRVMRTLSQYRRTVPQKPVAMPVFAGLAVMASLAGVILLLPAWVAMLDPWSFFFL